MAGEWRGHRGRIGRRMEGALRENWMENGGEMEREWRENGGSIEGEF